MASAHNDNEEENAIADVVDISAEEEDEEGDKIDSGSVEESEEEKIEEDDLTEEATDVENVIAEQHKEAPVVGSTGSGSGQLKTPEDEGDLKDVSDVSDAHDEEKTQHAHQNNSKKATDEKTHHIHEKNDMTRSNEETIPSPQRGTIAAIPEQQEYNSDAARRPGIDSGGTTAGLVPGSVMFVAGPGYTGTGIFTGYDSGAEDDTTIHEESVVLQGFLPEDDPTRQRNQNVESLEEHVQRLFDNAITLEDSAVRPIPVEGDDDEENSGLEAAQSNGSGGGGDDEAVKSDNSPWFPPLFLLVIAGCVILAIALPISLWGESRNSAQDQDMEASLSDAVCLPGSVDARFKSAKSILSSITSPDLLEDESTPQGKAIRWVVCEDSISVQLLGNQDPSTGNLPKQKHGFRLSGDAGKEQVTRRYILATVLYSTSQDSPWTDSLNFLSPDLHECHWHMNYTRQNFPFGAFDPVGVFCIIEKEGEFSVSVPFIDEFTILLDDENYPLSYLEINLRIDNDLNGPLPPEIGYLMDCRSFRLENQLRLTGQLPQTMGNMTDLINVALLLNGPEFGGELPSSLFQLRKLNTIHVEYNFGQNWSLPSNVRVDDDTQLERLLLKRNSFVGTIPSWIVELKRLQTLDLATNAFEGAIPEAIGDLSSMKYLSLMENNLTETIPSSVGKFSSIEVLILGNNALQGELPASLGNLSTLQLLDVGSNEMTSAIPSSFANLESLKYVVLESNRFNGPVDVLESMKNLTVLLIRSNSFSGSLPEELFSGTSDNIVVDIGDNKFVGDIPVSFANMSNLVSFIGAKNSFADTATQTAVCDNTTLLVMDCDACECCEVCCDGGENAAVCDFQLDAPAVLGYDCGTWFQFCLYQAKDFAQITAY